jgi:hypothetical protein
LSKKVNFDRTKIRLFASASLSINRERLGIAPSKEVFRVAQALSGQTVLINKVDFGRKRLAAARTQPPAADEPNTH